MAEDLTRLKVESNEREEARKGANFLSSPAMLKHAGLFLIQADGEMVAAEMPPSLLLAKKSILTLLAETGEVLLLRSAPEISPEKAAEILGISRPLVYQRMDSGKLPFRLVGRHRRVLVNDVMTLKRLEDQRRGLTDALDLDTGEATGPATTTEKSPSSARLPKSSDIDQLVLGTTNAPYRRMMSATDLVARITSMDWRNWIAHIVTFFTEVRPELVLEFAERHAIPIQDLAASYESMKSTTGESSPALESALERLV
ncbi:helix-turn-helix domain-containing protein [Bradyrhizobium elkanii]|uniref:helix-turn-helix domain-containing protein n=1 Tax=Bradyrhizobium elkanii TaxID=29448 RepID=UPI000841E970|nr:helix-turn-helix domain-containing protein [Bradyrhizobium elkanii]ODM75076.1 hypothetical protein A6452_39205 [Bradyrhizobium elkanii]ODM82739.1 hypothetical protein A6X20_16560 [Bradyrhizobium elkanii]